MTCGWVAGKLLVLALDVALGIPRQKWAREDQLKRHKERERRAEAAEFQAEFDEFMLALETAE